ncbi:ester cyclase [Terrisporobacter sp.]
MFDAFRNFTFSIKELIAEGDLVAAYMEFKGTHTGTLYGIAPTNKKVHFSLMMFLCIKDNKIIEKRSHVDVNDIISQLKS